MEKDRPAQPDLSNSQTSPDRPSQKKADVSGNKSLPTWLIIVSITLVCLVVTFSGWLVITTYFQKEPLMQEKNNSTDYSTDAEQEIAWVEYQSQVCNYSIKYPETWSVYTQAEQEETGTVLFSSIPIKGEESLTSRMVRVQIACSSVDPNLSRQEIIQYLNSRYQEESISAEQEILTIDNVESVYRQEVTPAQASSFEEYFVFPSVDTVVIVNISPANSAQIDTARAVLQTLSFGN